MTYDSTQDTLDHIGKVRNHLRPAINELFDRYIEHDQTKLHEPEKSIFDKFTPLLAATTYGSDEYKQHLAGMQEALDHHYATYRHHPEHFENGVHDMNLLDVLEMLADWKAATMRHADGDLGRSIQVNQQRFGYGDDFRTLLENTARDLGWL